MSHRSEFSAESEGRGARQAQESQSDVFAQLADAYRREGLLEEAIRICRDGLAARPASVAGRMVLGRALLEKRAFEDASGEFSRVLELSPDYLPALRLLGDAFAQRGQSETARACYQRVLQLNPFDRETQGRMATLPTGATLPAEVPGASFEERDRPTTSQPGAGTSAPREGQPGTCSVEGFEAAVPGAVPLATPTLAALYASQGHADVAQTIYRQLEHAVVPPPKDEVTEPASANSPVMESLLMFRAAARRLQQETRREPGWQNQ